MDYKTIGENKPSMDYDMWENCKPVNEMTGSGMQILTPTICTSGLHQHFDRPQNKEKTAEAK